MDALYMGGGAGPGPDAAGFRGGPPWRGWITIVALVGLAASFGKFGDPLWWARWGPFASTLGPHDSLIGQPIAGQFVHDGAGSVYGLLSMLLPGFSSFRYPSKLLTFMAVGLAVLAGLGWDRVAEGGAETRRLRHLGLAGLAVSLVGMFWALVTGDRAVAYLSMRIPPDPMFGPAATAGAWTETQRALTHGAIGFSALVALATGPRAARKPPVLALLLLVGDLALANARLVTTVPQAEFDARPEAARLIEAAERSEPSPGPFRVHRMPGLVSGPVRYDARPSAVLRAHRLVSGDPLPVVRPASGSRILHDDRVARNRGLRGVLPPETDAHPGQGRTGAGGPGGVARGLFPWRSFDLWVGATFCSRPPPIGQAGIAGSPPF